MFMVLSHCWSHCGEMGRMNSGNEALSKLLLLATFHRPDRVTPSGVALGLQTTALSGSR